MDKHEALTHIEALLDVGNLTRWEYSFLTDIGARLESGRDLTEDQQSKLDEIIDAKER